MPRPLLPAGVLVLALLAGCAKPDLPDVVVRSGSDKEFADFRADLGRRFPADRLATFDTATQELVLDALNRDVTPAAARDADMRAAVDGQTVHAARVLGWQARRQRLLHEIAYLDRLLEQDLERQQQTPTANIAARIQSARDVLDRLNRDLAETDRQLAEWGEERQRPET